MLRVFFAQVILFTSFSSAAVACPAYLVDEVTAVYNKLCIYEHLGGLAAVKKGPLEICPITIPVEHD